MPGADHIAIVSTHSKETNMKAQSVWFPSERTVEIREEEIRPEPGPTEVFAAGAGIRASAMAPR